MKEEARFHYKKTKESPLLLYIRKDIRYCRKKERERATYLSTVSRIEFHFFFVKLQKKMMTTKK